MGDDSPVSGWAQMLGDRPPRDPQVDSRCPPVLAIQLDRLARMLLGEEDLATVLAATCQVAVEAVPGCEAALVFLFDHRVQRVAGSAGPMADDVGEIERSAGEGPGVDAWRGEGPVVVDDLGSERRWPAFAPAAVTAGVRSVLACRLQAGYRGLGVLGLYSTRRSAFASPGPASIEVALAAQAAAAVSGSQAIEGLRAALASRETISVAMGILMTRENLSRQEAFDVLRRASQRENLKLRQIACRIAGDDEDLGDLGYG